MKREPEIGDVISFHSDKMKFVVEKAVVIKKPVFAGGGVGERPPIVYYHIWARELETLNIKDNEMWKYNQNGMSVNFPTGGWASNVVDPKDIEFHGQMKMIFVK